MNEFDDAVLRVMQKNDALDEGYRAYVQGKTRYDNPYNNNDEWYLNEAWTEGFLNAAWDD